MKNYKAKKSLGQNFLKSEPALRKIIEAGEIKKDDIILEIGPGTGALTNKLLETGIQVIAIEKDNRLFTFLENKFSEQIKSGKLILRNEDILNFQASAYSLKPSAYKIIANIPYNITGAILKKFLTEKYQPELMVLMVQHEVARRIIARDPRHGGAGNKESILSISVKAYGNPKLIMKVPARYFSPAPKVDSAIISIKNISRKAFEDYPPLLDKERAGVRFLSSPPPNLPLVKGEGNKIDEHKFWEIVKAGFAHKRKKLSSNLKGIIPETSLVKFGDKRPENLELADWIALASA